MKKISIVLASLIAFATAAAFADDALVLPARVLRITTALSMASADQAYDMDGEAQDMDSAISATALGAAFEYGINDWITGAIQWAPGYVVASDIEDTDAKLNGAYDIFVGAKLQVVGPKAPVANEQFRVAFAPGVKVPLAGADFEKEAEKAADGDEFIFQNPDKHVFGIGFRGYADYVVNKMFFVNLFTELIFYPAAAKYEDVSLTNYGTNAFLDAMGMDTFDEVNYGYDFKFEVEPTFQYMMGDGLRFGASLPLTYTMTPDLEIDGETVKDSASSLFQVGPNVSVFFLKSPVPVEVKAQYFLPLSGVNETKFSTLALVAKVYLKF
jgi:hypothetical protein